MKKSKAWVLSGSHRRLGGEHETVAQGGVQRLRPVKQQCVVYFKIGLLMVLYVYCLPGQEHRDSLLRRAEERSRAGVLGRRGLGVLEVRVVRLHLREGLHLQHLLPSWAPGGCCSGLRKWCWGLQHPSLVTGEAGGGGLGLRAVVVGIEGLQENRKQAPIPRGMSD